MLDKAVRGLVKTFRWGAKLKMGVARLARRKSRVKFCFQRPRFVFEIPKWECFQPFALISFEPSGAAEKNMAKSSGQLRNLQEMRFCCDFLSKVIIWSRAKKEFRYGVCFIERACCIPVISRGIHKFHSLS